MDNNKTRSGMIIDNIRNSLGYIGYDCVAWLNRTANIVWNMKGNTSAVLATNECWNMTESKDMASTDISVTLLLGSMFSFNIGGRKQKKPIDKDNNFTDGEKDNLNGMFILTK